MNYKVVIIILFVIIILYIIYKQRNMILIKGIYTIYDKIRTNEELPVVDVNLYKYMGTWHEMARLPNWFEKNLTECSATYCIVDRILSHGITLKNIGYLYNKSICVTGSIVPEGEIDSNGNTPGKFWVFIKDFPGRYYIIELDLNYEYVVVGEPTRQYAWIMTRSNSNEYFNTIFPAIYERLITKYGYCKNIIDTFEFTYK